jgi:hypothetical protein
MKNLFDFIVLSLTEIRLKKCRNEAEIPMALCEMADYFERHAKLMRLLAGKLQNSEGHNGIQNEAL